MVAIREDEIKAIEYVGKTFAVMSRQSFYAINVWVEDESQLMIAFKTEDLAKQHIAEMMTKEPRPFRVMTFSEQIAYNIRLNWNMITGKYA
jgi:hypothetical protein